MSPDEELLLAEICRESPIAARTLAKRLGWPQSTMFRCLTALEDAGLVEAVPPFSDDPLRRRVAINRGINRGQSMINLRSLIDNHALTPINDDFDAVLFDLGNVIVEIDFARVFQTWAKFAHADADDIAARYSQDVAYQAHERGEIDASAYFAHLRSKLQINITDAQFLEGWNAIFVGEIPGIAQQLEALALKRNIYAFSNSNKAHERYWAPRFADVLKPFRKVFVSSTLGLRKPDRAAFEYVVAEMGVAPQRILFLDDVAENIVGAQALGLQTVHVTSADVVRNTISALL